MYSCRKMNSIMFYLYGALGLILGYYIPYFSHKIMEYKKKDTAGKHNFLNYKSLKLILSIFNGCIWYMSALKTDNPLISLLLGIMVTTGLIIVYIDIYIRIIPNEAVLFMIITGVLFQIVQFGTKSLIYAGISMAAMMVVFTSVAGFVGFGKVGAGDIKLAGAMGISLGYPLIVTAVIAMAAILLIFIGVGLKIKKIYLSSMLPFAPFMISGYIFALIYFLA